MNSTTKIIGGFLAGAAVGIAAGMLMAPESGVKTRRRIKDESKRLTDQLTTSLSESLENVKKAYNKKLEHYAENGKHKIDSFKESVKA